MHLDVTNLDIHQVRITHLGRLYTTPEEFKNGDFTLKTHQMFSVHTPLRLS